MATGRPMDSRGRLKIGYHITAVRIQGQVEFAYRTHWTQVLTTILWGGRIDDVSRRVLTDALRTAADERHPVRIHAFAAAARDLFRHAAHTLAQRRGARGRRGWVDHPDCRAPLDDFIPEAGPLHDGLLAAARDLRRVARLQTHLPLVNAAEGDDRLHDALLAVEELSDSLGDYLEQIVQRLKLAIDRDAIYAVILETRREVNELAACCVDGEPYVEELTIAESSDKAVSFEVEASLGVAAPTCSKPGNTQKFR